MRKYRTIIIILAVIATIILLKVVWVKCATYDHGTNKEKREIVRRMNYLLGKVITSPETLLAEMPSAIGTQFQGEWALYTCSMTSAALVNLTFQNLVDKDVAIDNISKIIEIVLSDDIKRYDRMRWNEDPLESYGDGKSHLSYISHLAWMIGGFKQIGGDDRYDSLYHEICETMNRRILQSCNLNLPTYPNECIYIPDMLVAIVALHNYSLLYQGKYNQVVEEWMEQAKTRWLDKETGLLVSFLPMDSMEPFDEMPVKGSYSALNCYYLTLIDPVFAEEQYQKLKTCFLQTSPFCGIKEYIDRRCWFGMDIDAGPIIMNLSPSGTAFALGSATFFHDAEVRQGILKTAEIAGSTLTWFSRSHYLLSNVALVGEAIALAMRTTIPLGNQFHTEKP